MGDRATDASLTTVEVLPSLECGGLGVFAREPISPLTFLAAYPGTRIPVAERDPDRIISVKKLQYLATGHDGTYVIDPTNEHGVLCEEFVDEIGVRFNEPPPDKTPTAAFVSNYKMKRLEIWSIANIKPSEEIFLYYGCGYPRDYAISLQCSDVRNLCLTTSERGAIEAIIINDNTFFPEELKPAIERGAKFNGEFDSFVPLFLISLAQAF